MRKRGREEKKTMDKGRGVKWGRRGKRRGKKEKGGEGRK